MLNSQLRRSNSAEDRAPSCFETSEFSALFIEFETKDGTVTVFPYSQLVSYTYDAAQKHLVFTFSTHSVIVTGMQLGHFRSRLRDARITTLIESDARYANLQTTQATITSILVKEATDII